jgi:hypothetical protein
MGAVRTTFAMVSAQILRRKQVLLQGLADPFAAKPSTPGKIPVRFFTICLC